MSGGEAEREGEVAGMGAGGRIPSRLHAVSTEPDVGLKLTDHETMT